MRGVIRFKEEGPGRGWWGPPKGTHDAQAVPGGKAAFTQNEQTKRSAISAANGDIARAARSLNISEEMVEQQAAATIAAASEYSVAIQAPIESAVYIVGEGRFKNQHETGTTRGTFAPTQRAQAESTAFEIEGSDPSAFPIYGYMDIPGTHADQYGDVKFVLKESIKTHTSMTAGDSLRGFGKGQLTGTPVISPGKEGWDGHVEVLAQAAGRASYPASMFNYFEAQIHGGVRLSDVQFIEVRPPDYYGSGGQEYLTSLQSLADMNGIAIIEVP